MFYNICLTKVWDFKKARLINLADYPLIYLVFSSLKTGEKTNKVSEPPRQDDFHCRRVDMPDFGSKFS
jgi:hypothetical protein